MEITFYFNLNVTKTVDEHLTLMHKKHGKMEGCLRMYYFEGVFRRYDCDNDKLSKTLLENPNWSASFNYDEEEICIDNDLNNIPLTKEICFDEDWDDYEEVEPEMEILFQGDFYKANEFLESIESHDSEFIYDHSKITFVQAELNKVELEFEEAEVKELVENLDL